jgi:hypothetical protein
MRTVVMAGLVRGLRSFRLSLLEVFWPRKPDEHSHKDRGQDRIAGVVGQADREETEGEGLGPGPVPGILVQCIYYED